MTYAAHKVTRKDKKARKRMRRAQVRPLASSSTIRPVRGATLAQDLFVVYHETCKDLLAPFKKIDNQAAMKVRNSDRSREGRAREADFHKKGRRVHQARKLASVSGRAGRTLERLANLQLAAVNSNQADDLNYALES
jgi:hypothetical protein